MTNRVEFCEFLSVAALATILGVSRPTALALVRRGEIPGFRVGCQFRVPVPAVEQFFVDRGLDPSLIYRGTGSPATARPSPAEPANDDQRTPATEGAITR